jgi:acetamidase/formamidase
MTFDVPADVAQLKQSTTVHGTGNSHVVWDKSLKPVWECESGDKVRLSIVEASGGQLTKNSTAEALRSLDFGALNPVLGPIRVIGAEPGDVLCVRFRGFSALEWGWTACIPGFGLLADDFPEPVLKTYTLSDGEPVAFVDGIEIPNEPFAGTVGVALPDAGQYNMIPPRRNGGNMDMRHLTAGSTLYLPVWVEGALLSVGDTHAGQGDGEVCGTAIEAPMDVEIELSIDKGRSIKEPQCEVPPIKPSVIDEHGFHVTTGHGADLFGASQNAVRYMIEYLTGRYDLDPADAYMLCSLSVRLRISEIVNAPNWLVSAFFPEGVIK